MTLCAALWALAFSAFVSATLFPGASEAVLAATVASFPEAVWVTVAVAAAANTAGSITTYGIGRFFPKRTHHRALTWFERYGAPALLLAWLPVLGDALPLVAGWLRICWLQALLFIAIGKTLRYAVIAWGALHLV